ncbi:MAG: hypothetical protein ACYTG0_12300 [Planctomycetota bacterium]|jgi:hypothetical protein
MPSLFVTSCPSFLALLEGFCVSLPGRSPSEAEIVPSETIPEPYRRLLVHLNDMTSTLTKYHGEGIKLRVLEREVTDATLARHIVLETAETRRPVEYGAIRINLAALEGTARNEVLECRRPLGGILNAHGVPYECCPGGFFRVRSNELIDRVFQLDEPQWLYGRCNCLKETWGPKIAEVVEILPPGLPPGQVRTREETTSVVYRDPAGASRSTPRKIAK